MSNIVDKFYNSQNIKSPKNKKNYWIPEKTVCACVLRPYAWDIDNIVKSSNYALRH